MDLLLGQYTVDGELTPEFLARKAELEQEMETEIDSIKGARYKYVEGQWLSNEQLTARIRQKYSDLWQQELTQAGYLVRPMFESIEKPSTKWSVEEDAWLRANYPTANLDACAVYLGRSYAAVITHLKKLGIPLAEQMCRAKMEVSKSNRHRWTKEEEQWLLENYTTFGIVGCAEKLGVAQSAIDHKIHRLRKA